MPFSLSSAYASRELDFDSSHFSEERPAANASKHTVSSDDEDNSADTPDEHHVITMDVYSMDSHAHVNQLKLSGKLFPPSSLPSLRLVEFGKHTHLVGLNSQLRCLVSHSLLTKSKNKTLQLHKQGSDRRAARDRRQANYLDYLYTVYDKFPVEDCLGPGARSLHFTCVWNMSDDELRQQIAVGNQSSGDLCYNYLQDLFDCLKRRTKKPMDELRRMVDVITLDDCRRSPLGYGLNEQVLGKWIQRLISLVPIQLCRAEQNQLTLFSNGKKSSLPASVNTEQLLAAIEVGLYEDILDWWTGPVKVISSMGKQSTGKSYMLNHLTGSLFDISGGRCTDGAWLTTRIRQDCLYVVLDFEGLGSMERKPREDMLLSLLNASMSGFTIFKAEYRVDQNMRNMLSSFRDGMELMPDDPQLFCGCFCINIKDVPLRDIADITTEFQTKLGAIVREDPENNFLTKLYKGRCCVQAFPELGKAAFYEEMKKTVGHLQHPSMPQFADGRAFKNLLKLVLVKLHKQEWSGAQARTKGSSVVDRLRVGIGHAIEFGMSINQMGDEEPMARQHGEDLVEDEPLQLHCLPEYKGPLDSGFRIPSLENTPNGMQAVLAFFQAFSDLRGSREALCENVDAVTWTTQFQEYLNQLCNRRAWRVRTWLRSHLADDMYRDDQAVRVFTQTVEMQLESMCQQWVLCRLECATCHYQCLLLKHHEGEHDCLGDHKCPRRCNYCTYEAADRSAEGHSSQRPLGGAVTQDMMLNCSGKAGHKGKHDCKQRAHVCGQLCHLSSKDNCKRSCAKKKGHEIDTPGDVHKCSSQRHNCSEPCTLPGCNKPCIMPVDVAHDRHKCREQACPKTCQASNCNNKCWKVDDHFHDLTSGGDQPEHFCELHR